MYRFTRFRFLAIASLCVLSPFLHADTLDREDDREIDVQALREWINTKRQVSIKEIGGNLSLSGEVRTEFQITGETNDGIKQRGSGAPAFGGIVYPNKSYDVAVNITLDYRADRTWSAIKLEFDNSAGIFGGSTDKIKLSKAYFGTRLYDGDSNYFDVEIGRKKLSTIFDSREEFSAYFDGILLKYDQSFDNVGDFFTHVGVFVVDERQDRYAYVGETGLMNIADTGIYTKFSLIDWDTKNTKNQIVKERFDFLVSQFLLGYRCFPLSFQKQITVYLAGLYNFAANRLPITANKLANWGSYIGFSIGELKRKGDWAIDANYQFLAAQCVPDYDNSGIGLGNISNAGLYTADINGKGGPTTVKTAAGSGNYRGIIVTLEYLLTNNLNLQQQWQQAVTLDKDIGPYRRYKQYEIEFVYGF